MTTLFTVLQILACLILITAVLLQPSKGGAALGGSAQSVFGSSGATSFLFKITMWMAFFIMASSIYLSHYRIQESRRSVINATAPLSAGVETSAPNPGTATPIPSPAAAPNNEAPKNVEAPLAAPGNSASKTAPAPAHK